MVPRHEATYVTSTLKLLELPIELRQVVPSPVRHVRCCCILLYSITEWTYILADICHPDTYRDRMKLKVFRFSSVQIIL